MTNFKPRRPFSVTLLTWMVFIMAILSFLRLGLTLEGWEFLAGLPQVSPVYLAISGAVWGILGLPLAWGIWRGKSWATPYTLAALVAYTIYFWVDRFLLSGYPERNSDWPFAVALNILIILWSVWILSRPKARHFFGDIYERGNR